MPTLIAVAHGTRSPHGQAQIRDLVARVAARRPGLDVRLTYVDVQEPKVADVVPLVGDAVVVPLLLSAGYHVRVDIAEAVAARPIPVTRTLGPDDALLDSMIRRLPRGADAVVLAAAGSSDPAWRADIDDLAAKLGAHVGYVAGHDPKVADVVAGLRKSGAKKIAIASYLLADGLFYRKLHQAGADWVTPPLCLDPITTDLVLSRYESALLTTAESRL
ncbi:sirohydrochlorin chelatase [Paractinoplanes atraurantiacus]|uniref:Sirohydrochlorin ferrochelatase n=1 Tax=Paractinoplanes atraurantiacus TaxID=1036182 RepID=A0A285K176_9ACTN|nr:sirohydrochlorin chelatase [Actinoplanes atraurantiacus]SNY66315.1 Sirohydrochlorin ferrochelatase [Actinoplanes atraurantiacus]